jgi:CDP-6-deoxy-D-xylo-4-hexulose-3-dehydrase
LGSKYEGKYTGSFGDIATLSFYPAHHITTAEGGAVLTNNLTLSKIVRSIRDWGRHCWCQTGHDNTCKNRYNWQLGDLPKGYDHKYIYGELGYNLKLSDLHAAIGVAQMEKLPGFIKKRIENYKYLHKGLMVYSDYFILPEPTNRAEPSWFGFLITIKNKGINREELLQYLNEKKIGTRLLFGGNILKQLYFVDNKDIKYRVVGDLKNTNIAMTDTFWLGTSPGIGKKEIDYVVKNISEYIATNQSKK